jgi:uncharacterized protein with FMN-binding domain
MPKSPKTVYVDDEVISQIESIAFKDDRTFSNAVNVLLKEAITARSMPEKPKPATN